MPEDDFLQMHIANADGAIKDYKAGYWGIAESMFGQEILPPRTHISEMATIYFNRSTPRNPDQYLAFPHAGTYFLQAALRNISTRELLLSNIVRVDLVHPTGVNIVIWKRLRDYDTAVAYQLNCDGGFKFNGLLPFLAQFPNSLYAHRITEKFGETQPRQLLNAVTSATSPAKLLMVF